MSRPPRMTIDGAAIEFTPGQTVMEAASAAQHYIPHLCYHPEYPPGGNCKLCTVKFGDRYVCACTTAAENGMQIENDLAELRALRRSLLQLMFVEGNHICPSCERSGNCQLQACAYAVGMHDNHFHHLFPQHRVDASHPEVIFDPDRCILCGLCVRASEADGKNVFVIGGRGSGTQLRVRSPSGLLGDSDLAACDKAAQICPTGALLVRGEGFRIPVGERLYDTADIAVLGNQRPRYSAVDKASPSTDCADFTEKPDSEEEGSDGR